MFNLKGSEITLALFNTIKNAKKDNDILSSFNINIGKRYDAQNTYIKILYSVNRHDGDYYQGTFRNEYYQILIGIGSYGNNDFLKQTTRLQETITFLRILLQTSEDMIVRKDDDILDLRDLILVEDCYPSYRSNGDVINEGVMNLCFNLNEHLYTGEKMEIKEIGSIKGDVRLWRENKKKKRKKPRIQ